MITTPLMYDLKESEIIKSIHKLKACGYDADGIALRINWKSEKVEEYLKKDIYDLHEAELLEAKDFRWTVRNDWVQAKGLFKFVDNYCQACLTMIRGSHYLATTPELTRAIKGDSRIPFHYNSVEPDNLQVFKEWQRRLDKELGREVPTINAYV